MEKFSELAVVLKTFPYQERDKVVVFFSENHGKISGLAKNSVHSRRYGGSLDFLACSQISFTKKPHAELVQINEAISKHEFKNIALSYEKLTVASFATELCLKTAEPHAPARELFSVLSNFLFYLDQGMPEVLALNSFLCKAMNGLGYPPVLNRCSVCEKTFNENTLNTETLYWNVASGGAVCQSCTEGHLNTKHATVLTPALLSYFLKIYTTSFKQLLAQAPSLNATGAVERQLYVLLNQFLIQHLPNIPVSGFKSQQFLENFFLNR